MDLKGYKIKMTVKSCCLFEQITGKSFFECTTNEDAVTFMYCSLIANNDLNITLAEFNILIQNENLAKWIENEYKRVTAFNSQFNSVIQMQEEGEGKTIKYMKMTDIATSLILQYKVDAYYVYNDMGLWEINHFFQTASNIRKEEATDKRLWTYLTIAPHINTNKVRSPEGLIQFEWEKKANKKKAEEDLDGKKELINRIIGRQLKNGK